MSRRPGKDYADPMNAFCDMPSCALSAVWQRWYGGRMIFACDIHARGHMSPPGTWDKIPVATEKNAASLDLTKPVQTRGGSKARIVCTDHKGSRVDPRPRTVIALVEHDGVEVIGLFPPDGLVFPGEESSGDLINVPEKKKHRCVVGASCCQETAAGVFIVQYGERAPDWCIVGFCPHCGEKAPHGG